MNLCIYRQAKCETKFLEKIISKMKCCNRFSVSGLGAGPGVHLRDSGFRRGPRQARYEMHFGSSVLYLKPHNVIVPANLILPTAEASYEILTQRHGSRLTLSLTKQSHDTAESVC